MAGPAGGAVLLAYPSATMRARCQQVRHRMVFRRRGLTRDDCSVYTRRQLSRHSCAVVFMTCRNTLQANALKLAARKLQSSLADDSWQAVV